MKCVHQLLPQCAYQIEMEMEEEITEKDTKIQQLEQQVNTRVPYMHCCNMERKSENKKRRGWHLFCVSRLALCKLK